MPGTSPTGVIASAGGAVDHGAALAWYDRWLEAWSSQDPESIRPLITDDFVLESPTTRHTGWRVAGPDQTRDYLAYVMRAYPDITWERTLPGMYAEDEPRAAFWWRGSGHFTGVLDPPGIAGTGRAFTFEGIEVFDFRGDRAMRLRAAYDLHGLLKQIGVTQRRGRG
jgi:ketosteroid isomerase-like protein